MGWLRAAARHVCNVRQGEKSGTQDDFLTQIPQSHKSSFTARVVACCRHGQRAGLTHDGQGALLANAGAQQALVPALDHLCSACHRRGRRSGEGEAREKEW